MGLQEHPIPVHPDDRWLLGMVWEDKLLVDTALPFGLRTAPFIFSAVAEALGYIMRKDGIKEVDHYLDDFSLVAKNILTRLWKPATGWVFQWQKKKPRAQQH